MDFEKLRHFKTIALTENMTQASKLLHITQPALSLSISRLEKQLGSELFDRIGKSVRLNPAGKSFLGYAEQILMLYDDARHELEQHKNQSVSRLVLGITSFVATQNAIRSYQKSHPQVILKQRQLYAPDFVSALKKRDVELAISNIESADPEIESCELLRQRMLLAVPLTHRFARLESMDLFEARNEGFICMPEGHADRVFFDWFCRQAGFEQKVVFEYFQSQMLETVAAGIGLSLAIHYPKKNTRYADRIAFIPITNPDYPRIVWIQRYKGITLLDTAKEFIEYLMWYCSEYLPEDNDAQKASDLENSLT